MKMRGRQRIEPALAVAASDADDERLAGVLVAAGAVKPYQLDAARAAQSGTLAEQLIAAGRGHATRRWRAPSPTTTGVRRARLPGRRARTRTRWRCSPRSRRATLRALPHQLSTGTR